MTRVCPKSAASRGGIATLLAILFAVGSIFSVNPEIHALLHAEDSAQHSHSDENEQDANHSPEHSEGCFLCELASGSVELVDCGAQVSGPARDDRRERTELPNLYLSRVDRRLPPILGPPLI